MLEKIQKREARIGVIGMGYVGLPLALTFCRGSFRVLGFDIDPHKISALNAGKSYIKHIPAESIQSLLKTGLFACTGDFNRLAEMDCVIICVPTPLTEAREPDLSYIRNTAEAIAPHLHKNQLVVLESTTYPGTTREVVQPILEAGGLRAGTDFFLAFSPEREDPGNPSFVTATIPKVVGGFSPRCQEIARALYGSVINIIVPVSSLEIAEFTKIVENIYRAVNIALVNELKMLCDRMNIDVWEVIRAAETKPFGFKAFYPGPGLGGHCIPIDPFYLTWKAREFDFSTRFIELAGEINSHMPYYVVERTLGALNDRGRSLKGARALVLGVAYKKDVDDMRESPALKIIDLLLRRGAEVDFSDPHVPVLPPTRHYRFEMQSVPLTPKTIAAYDVLVLVTEHTAFDYESLAEHGQLIIDTRNGFKDVTRHRDKIFKA